MPRPLRGWKPPDTLPAAARLPAPGWVYEEMEAMLALGYTLAQWRQENAEDRARLVAHHLHRTARRAWESHWLAKHAERGGRPDPVEDLRRQFFG